MDDLAASFRRLAHAARVASDQFKATAPLLKNRNPVSTTPRPRRWEYALLIALILAAAWFAAAGRGLL
jgi:hypothetical protein